MTAHRKAASIVMLVLLAIVCTDCFPRRGYYGRRSAYRPYRARGVGSWLAAAVVGAAIVGTAAAVAAADQARYNANVCRARTWHNGRWIYYCHDRWAYYEGNQWFAFAPSAPPQGPPPGQPPPGQPPPGGDQPPPGYEGQPPPGAEGPPPAGAPPPSLPPPGAPPPMP